MPVAWVHECRGAPQWARARGYGRRSCAWCGRPFDAMSPNAKYDDARCSQAHRDHKRGRGGTPGVRPTRQIRRYQTAA